MGSREDAILPGPLEAVKHVSAITELQKVLKQDGSNSYSTPGIPNEKHLQSTTARDAAPALLHLHCQLTGVDYVSGKLCHEGTSNTN